MSELDLETCCIALDSTKITERKKHAESLRDLLNSNYIIQLLHNNGDNGSRRNWDYVYASVHKYIKREGEKLYADETKQKSSLATVTRVKNFCQSLLIAVVTKANAGETRLSVSKLIDTILQCFNTEYLKQYFGDTYCTILIKFVLQNRKYWGEIGIDQWKKIYHSLKSLYENPVSEIPSQNVTRGLYLTIKWGCLHSTLNLILRKEFEFIRIICLSLKSKKFQMEQENVLKLLLSFSVEVSKDCRTALCKLGEELILPLIDLYEPRFERFGGKKSLIFDYLLLQVRLHHPNGATEGSDLAYAHNWTEWKSSLRSLYSILCNEVDVIERLSSDKWDLWPNFLSLIVDVSKQLFHTGIHDITQAAVLANYSQFSQPLPKKPRLDIGITAAIYAIQSTDNKTWLRILAELLTTYPNIIQPSEFITLLEFLANLQSECKDLLVRDYLYHLLSTMVETQEQLPEEVLDLEQISALWLKIWETSLRSVGLNQNIEATHHLLQAMLYRKRISQPAPLLQIYVSGVNVSQHSLQTLHMLCKSMVIPEYTSHTSDITTRKYLINWVLGLQNNKLLNSSVFKEKITAEILAGLVLKSWPYQDRKPTNIASNREYKSIEKLYKLTCFEGSLLINHTDATTTEKNHTIETKNTYLPHRDSLEDLKHSLTSLMLILCENSYTNYSEVIDLINGIILMIHLLSELFEFSLLNEETLSVFVDIQKLMKTLSDILNEYIKTKSDNNDLLNQLVMLFSTRVSEPVAALLRRHVSIDFLKIFFDLLNSDNNEDEDDTNFSPENDSNDSTSCFLKENNLKIMQKMQLKAMQILSNFCCVPNVNYLNQRQEQVLETLSDPNFNPADPVEVQTTLCFIRALNSCKQNSLSDGTVNFILKSLSNLMQFWHKDYDAALLMLQILKDSLPLIKGNNLELLKQNALILLEPFYERRDCYGPKILIVTVECLGILLKVDLLQHWSKNKNIIEKMLAYLKIDFQEVRLAAIKELASIFAAETENSIAIMEKEKQYLYEIYLKIMASLAANEDQLNEYGGNDEVANCTACILHAHAVIVVVSPSWRKRSLFAFIKYISKKKLKTDFCHKILTIIAQSLNIRDFQVYLEMNINYIILQWSKANHSFNEFPFHLFECQTDLSFFTRNVNLIVPVLLQTNDTELLKTVCQVMQKSLNEIIRDSFPAIMAQFLPPLILSNSSEEHNIPREDIYMSKRLFKQLEEIYSQDRITTMISEMSDDIFLHLLGRFYDQHHFKTQFEFEQNFSEPDPPHFKYNILSFTFEYIQKILPSKESESLMSYYIKNCPNKLEHILLEMTVALNKALTFEEKLLSLHRYSVFVDYIIAELNNNQNEMSVFLIRSIIYTLMNLIKMKQNDTLLCIAACRYFKAFCSKCLVQCAKIIQKYLTLITGTLVPIAKLSTALSIECVSVLNFLIVENIRYLYNGIEQLDPFPADRKFCAMQEVYEKIRHGNDKFTLKEEIVHFLSAGNALDVSDRTEGLQHLKAQLCEKKTELAELYENLNKLRGFYEDREESILHQLICMLVNLTKSADTKVRLEAARCLGELGPSDLTTLVLKSEQALIEDELSPLQLVTGQIITLLTQYLVNEDIEVAKAASDALYVVVATKEGRQITNTQCDIDFGCGRIERSYVIPFLPMAPEKPKSSSMSIDEKVFQETVNNIDLWSPSFECAHSQWIISLVSKLLEIWPATCYLHQLISVCQVKVEFAEKMLPLLIYLILCQNRKICSAIISSQIQLFFSKHWATTITSDSGSSQELTNKVIVLNKVSVKCMLDVIHFVRLRQSTTQDRKVMNELNLNYLHVANGAQYCSAHFTAILYAELWCYSRLDDYNFSAQSSGASVFDYLRKSEPPETAQALENILREGYKKVGDIDAMYGCGTSYIFDTASRVDYYKDLHQWDKVTLHYDLQLQHGFDSTSPELINSLKWNSFHYLASHLNIKNPETQYECAWRLGQWNITESGDTASTDTNGFEKYHYFALKLLHEDDSVSLSQAVTEARKSVISVLSHASLESSKNLYAALSQLQMIQEIENVSKAKVEMKLPDLFEKWKLQNDLVKNEFDYIEPIKAQRLVVLTDLLRGCKNAEEMKLIKSLLADFHLRLAAEARTEGFHHVAQRSLTSLSFIKGLPAETQGRILLEQAQLSWLDDKVCGRHLLRHFLDKYQADNPTLYAHALKLYGNWMVDTRSENASVIMKKYFEKPFEILNSHENTRDNLENICDVLDCMANFADSQFQQVSNYINSSVFEGKLQTIEKFKSMAKKFSRDHTTNDERRAKTLYERQCAIDVNEVQNIRNERNHYLILAVRQYIKILIHSDKYNLKLFRILSLCVGDKTNKELLNILENSLFKIPSYKYIPLLPQFVPHGGNNPEDVFESIVTKLLERCALDHPHHTLPIIMALADSYKDRDYDPENRSENAEMRVQIAKSLVQHLAKKKELSSIIKNMEALSTALIKLAYLDNRKSSEKKKQFNIPRGEDIRSIKNYDNILLPTFHLNIRKNCNYDNIVGVREYDSSYNLVGGVNAPKQITCVGTDGIRRTQLIKGKDDLRQDAVMQQVFNILNTLLANNKQTSKLLIRTYKVVPLSQRSGVIEWCENTDPIGKYLCDAHKRYHPSDLTPNECRTELKNVSFQSPEMKLKKFKEVCARFRPVFHQFFISSFPQPTVWFERRRAYMHSVATSSMVGYILGLGDRHVTNILIDKTTAEVIHIDFGIAFEQGRILPTPETVPFRLTRDIEAGMGVCGIEGVFRRSCEKTMYVLRQNSKTVLTILEVLLYDPLYAWTITPAEAYSRQRDDEQDSISFSEDKGSGSDGANVNVTAERVLSRLRQKLQGTEDGGVYSVEGQVDMLLQQARDIENLSRLYNGWQAYL